MTLKQELLIIGMARKINGPNQRKKSKTGDLPTVFVDIPGHVALIQVRVFENGWQEDTDADREFEFSTDQPLDEVRFEAYRRYIEYLKQKMTLPTVQSMQSQGTK